MLTFSDACDINTLNPHLRADHRRRLPLVDDDGVAHQVGRAQSAVPGARDRSADAGERRRQQGRTDDHVSPAQGRAAGRTARRSMPTTSCSPPTPCSIPQTTKSVAHGWDQIAKIDEPDKYTVVYHLKKPYSPFVETFFSTAGANPCILPKHLLAKYPNINNVPYNSLPVGIGPFKYERWDRGAATSSWWPTRSTGAGAEAGEDRFTRSFPTATRCSSQLQAHELDMWYPFRARTSRACKRCRASPSSASRATTFSTSISTPTRPGVAGSAVRAGAAPRDGPAELIDKIGHGVGIAAGRRDAADRAVLRHVDPADAVRHRARPTRCSIRPDGSAAPTASGRRTGRNSSLTFATNAGAPTPTRDRAHPRVVEADRRGHHRPALSARAHVRAAQPGRHLYCEQVGRHHLRVVQRRDRRLFADLRAAKRFPPNGQNDMRWCNPRAQAAMDGALRTLRTAAAKRRRRDRAEEFVQRRPDDHHRDRRGHLSRTTRI